VERGRTHEVDWCREKTMGGTSLGEWLGHPPSNCAALWVSQKKTLWRSMLTKKRSSLKKYEPACIFCGNADKITHFRGKNICQECARDMGPGGRLNPLACLTKLVKFGHPLCFQKEGPIFSILE